MKTGTGSDNFVTYIAKNNFDDLSVAVPGEQYEAVPATWQTLGRLVFAGATILHWSGETTGAAHHVAPKEQPPRKLSGKRTGQSMTL